MTSVVLGAFDVANSPDVGGHFWVYAQYADALRREGCEVHWLEELRSSGDRAQDEARVQTLSDRLGDLGLADGLLVYATPHDTRPEGPPRDWVTVSEDRANAVMGRADLLLNFHYAIPSDLLSLFRRTALVDLDPGLLQHWWRTGQLRSHPHDVYFSIGEHLPAGTPGGGPDVDISWIHTRPAVSLDLWPYCYDGKARHFTTVSSWWGGEWVTDGTQVHDNHKRASFLTFADLPGRTDQPLELALALGQRDRPELAWLESLGWTIRPAPEVAATPSDYRAYIQGSRGEFSCAKSSYLNDRNGWISDRTVCYLASGKPAVVQDTGPSGLPEGQGLKRFSTAEEAVNALAEVNAAYEHHCRAARELAETYFCARKAVTRLLRLALP